MISKRNVIIILAIIVGSIVILGLLFSDRLPISLDRSTYSKGYQLENAFPNLTFQSIVTLTNDGGQNLYAVEQQGKIFRFQNSRNIEQAELFLDITSQVTCCGETGLLGLVFDPDFSTNGYFYVDYTAADPLRTVVSRFTVIDGQVDTNSELIIITVNQPYSNHNAGTIVFGPDKMLYITLGDGGSGGDPQGNGQNLSTFLGSILRINVTAATKSHPYQIPPDNPFVNLAGANGEIWAYGLRNPWKISFDSQTGDLWVGDVGQNSYEEVDLIVKGANYGWNVMEGTHCYQPSTNCDQTGLTLPVIDYGRDQGKTVVGGFVYRGTALPDLVGKYIFADYLSGRFWHLDAANPSKPNLTDFMKYNLYISGLGEDANHELYALSYGEGIIYRIVPQTQPT